MKSPLQLSKQPTLHVTGPKTNQIAANESSTKSSPRNVQKVQTMQLPPKSTNRTTLQRQPLHIQYDRDGHRDEMGIYQQHHNAQLAVSFKKSPNIDML